MDLTTIFTAAIAGLSGVTAGYLGIRQQTRTMQEQLKAEREQEGTKRKESLQDHRAETYGSLLQVERGLRRLLASGKTFSGDDYGKWWGEYQQLTDQVILTGTATVSADAERLVRLYGDVDQDRMDVESQRFAESLIVAFQRHQVDIEQARTSLVDSMRADIAPDGLQGRARPARREPLTTHQPAPGKLQPDHHDIAVVSTTKVVSLNRLRQVAAAVEKQIRRDFASVWGPSASLTVYEDAGGVPPGAWRITLADDIGAPGMASYHSWQDAKPFTMVNATIDSWEASFSHDCLEMLINPFNKFFKDGPSPGSDRVRVKFSVQVCDPCAAQRYTIDGVTVSDFVYPDFYQPLNPAGKRLDHEGVITQPLEMAPGGYLTWYEGGHLRQRFADSAKSLDLGPYDDLNAVAEGLRVGFFLPSPNESVGS